MPDFISQLDRQFHQFSAVLSVPVDISHPCFTFQHGTVEQFLDEMQQTARHLSTEQHAEYAAYYAEKLVQQFDALKQAVDKAQKSAKMPTQFRSSYRFSKNIHRLSPEKRLVEYKKALRALNEKLAWLSEQSYLAPQTAREQYISLIAETEYRKQRCLAEIEALEAEVYAPRNV